jgi:hypothetical protein
MFPELVLTQMVWLLIIRRLHREFQSYDAIFAVHPFLFGTFWLQFQVTQHTPLSNAMETKTYQMTYWNIITRMKLNLEGFDYCTLAASEIFEAARANLQMSSQAQLRLCVEIINVISFFGSRKCLHEIKQLVLDSAGDLNSRNFRKRVLALIKGTCFPHTWFSRSFNPNRIKHRQVKKAKRPHQLAARLFSKFCRKLPWKAWGLHKKKRCTKRTAASFLGRAFGNFVGKNFFQLIKLAVPTMFGKSKRTADMYTECGPGCRGMLNQLEGWPKTANIYSNNQALADMYFSILMKWKTIWGQVCTTVKAQLPEELQHLATWLHDMDEGEFQFVLCEAVKVLAYITGLDAIYTRDFWADR